MCPPPPSSASIDWLVFNVQRAFFQLYSRAQGFTPVRPFVYPAFSFSQKFWKFYTLLNSNQVKLSQAIIPFMVPELCPLNNWKTSILWFLCYNLSFPQPNVLKFLHHVLDHNTQVKYNFGCGSILPGLCSCLLLLEAGLFCVLWTYFFHFFLLNLWLSVMLDSLSCVHFIHILSY